MYALVAVRVLSFKNRLKQITRKKKDLFLYLIIPFFPFFVFFSSKKFILELISHPRFDLIILSNIVYFLIFSFSLIVIMASMIASIGNLYSAKDLTLLLTLPITKSEILRARFISIIIESSWTILLFLLPILFAIGSVLNLPFSFYLSAITAVILLTSIASSLGLIISCSAVNILGPKACIELIIVVMSMILIYSMTFSKSASPEISMSNDSIEGMISYFSNDFSLKLSPNSFCSRAISSFWDKNLSGNNLLILFSLSLFCFSIATICFNHFSTYTPKEKKARKKFNSKTYRRLRKLFPLSRRLNYFFNSPLLAFISKEAKTLFRDLSQSTQFLLLIFITFVYLLNFHQLKQKPNLEPENLQWWFALLAISNITLSSCVLTAIATRFVFPSISMEGRSFTLLRSAPITLYSLMLYKFTTWFIPFCAIALTIQVAGIFAIDANYTTLIYTLFIGLNLSVGLVSTAIGTGARYARFDWESPSQVAAGFGSLVLMLKLLAVVTIYIIQASIILTISCLESRYSNQSLLISVLIATLMIFTSTILLRDNLRSGSRELALQE